MESLKKFEEICEKDIRHTFFSVMDVNHPGIFRKRTLKDFYRTAESIQLHAGVPDEIRSHFETARNLIVYTWFYYPFNVTAQLSAYISAEYALRVKLKSKRKKFSELLKMAVEKGWITDEGFSLVRNKRKAMREYNQLMPPGFTIPEVNAVAAYSRMLADNIPKLRNQLAHGDTCLHNYGAREVRICAELINQLFQNPASAN